MAHVLPRAPLPERRAKNLARSHAPAPSQDRARNLDLRRNLDRPRSRDRGHPESLARVLARSLSHRVDTANRDRVRARHSREPRRNRAPGRVPALLQSHAPRRALDLDLSQGRGRDRDRGVAVAAEAAAPAATVVPTASELAIQCDILQSTDTIVKNRSLIFFSRLSSSLSVLSLLFQGRRHSIRHLHRIV